MNGGRWRRRRCSSGRTSSIVTVDSSHFERTISVEHCAFRADVGGREVALDDPLGSRRSARARRRPARPPRARGAPSSTRSPAAGWRLRRSPAVSTSWNVRPSRSSTVSIASRVVPGTSETIVRSLADQRVEERRLADVRPAEDRDADRLVADRSAAASPTSSSRATISSSRSPVPCRACPRAGTGRRGRAGGARARASSCDGSSILFASTSTGLCARAQDLGQLLVARRHAGAGVDDEEHEVGLRDRRRAPARRSSA